MKSEIEKIRAGFQPVVTNRAEIQPTVTMIVYDNWHGNVRTEKILNRRTFAGSDASGSGAPWFLGTFSLVVRIRSLEQNLGFIIAYQPHAAARGFNDNLPRKTAQPYSSSV
jgi:hypothetical protein